MQSRTKNVSRNIIWGFLSKILILLLPFLTRTTMIYTLGELYLGLNGLFTSILDMLMVTELGVSTAIVFSMYKPIAEGNDEEVCALLNLYRHCYRIIGIVVLVIGLAILPFLGNLISGEIPDGINIYILYLMNLCRTVLSYELFAHYTSLLTALQRNDMVSKVQLFFTIIRVVLQISSLILLKNYYVYIAIMIVTSILINIINAMLCHKYYPHYTCHGSVSTEIVAGIKLKIKGMIFSRIGGVVLTSVDTIVISAFLGLRTLAIYQNYYYILASVIGILNVIITALTATVGNSVAVETKLKNYNDFTKFNFIYIWIVSCCSMCLLGMYQPFIELWVGKSLMFSGEIVILFVGYFYFYRWCDMLQVYQDATGIWWETRFIPLIAAIVNLVINILLVRWIGIGGILISTIISMIFIYNPGFAIVLFKSYFKEQGDLKKYLYRQLKYVVTWFISGLLVVLLCRKINAPLVIQLLINGLISIIIPNIIFCALWHFFPEFKDMIILVKRIIKRK